ncbi:hypothetical protein [Pseudomonas nitroreducens]|uniref:hypothetical protein n=1 Tax=Pseudomonas nitroreducens TaxID=46680 RepID=UPI0026591DE4|nr:hypothetical protein [Pseudomonas nitroreducens]MCP1647872.1 hypothetical protein [Pseudomonas nitroreducens]MCP1686448.1 hypothetical protein [Pseudomonas nitroreducens]
MSTSTDAAIEHYSAALHAIDAMRPLLRQYQDPYLLTLLARVEDHFENGFWLAHLRVLSNIREIPATPYCRRIPLTPPQARHIDVLRTGMLEAQHSLAPDDRSAPWNALFSARQQHSVGIARQCFETGFLIRFFQLLQEARHGVPQWSLGARCITPGLRKYRYRP